MCRKRLKFKNENFRDIQAHRDIFAVVFWANESWTNVDICTLTFFQDLFAQKQLTLWHYLCRYNLLHNIAKISENNTLKYMENRVYIKFLSCDNIANVFYVTGKNINNQRPLHCIGAQNIDIQNWQLILNFSDWNLLQLAKTGKALMWKVIKETVS